MANQEVTIFGTRYLTDDALVFGDYGGGGSVGLANINWILEEAEQDNLRVENTSMRIWNDWSQWGEHGYSVDEWDLLQEEGEPPDVIETYGGHGSRQVWVRVPPEHGLSEEELDEGAEDPHEDLRQLVEAVNGLEDYPLINEDEHSQIEMNWEVEAWEQWARADLLDTVPDFWEEWADDWEIDLWELYRAAMERENQYPEMEYSGAHIPIDKIKDAFFEGLVHALTHQVTDGRYVVERDRMWSEREWLEALARWVRNELEEAADHADHPDDERHQRWYADLQEEYARLQDEIASLP